MTLLTAGAIVLSGCTPEQAAPAAVATSATPAASPTPESATPAGAKTGDIVDDATSEAINGEYIDPMRKDMTVKLSSGENILVKKAEPLPKVVIDSVTKDVKTAAPNYANDTSNDSVNKMADIKRDLEERTGRMIATVVYGNSYNDNGTWSKGWFVGEPATEILGQYPSKEAAIAAVEGWVAKSPAMRTYIVIDTEG
ncbi:hypothetical protein [Microbacterium sp. 11MF]|uniref:hypothetical protein n=1 Tax=Microbacterium sp. 11MF TaxID=1169146 RepID=UPI0003A9DEF5|nr:hypothetical protein [Microbacterium sp. 11MF]